MENKKSDIKKLLHDFMEREQEMDVVKLGNELMKPENEKLLDEFNRLRHLTDLSANEEKIWQGIQIGMKKKTRNIMSVYMKYVAMLVLPLCVGMLGWKLLFRENVSTSTVVEKNTLVPGNSNAYLVLSGGERLNLSSMLKDTMFVEHGAGVQIDSSGRVSYFVKNQDSKKEIIYNTIVVPRAGEYNLLLADGTRVWLNSESELRYPVEFSGDRREVYLKGEGYFEVARDEEKPFYVQADDVVIRVLGTTFDVNAYRDRGAVLTTLVSGRVTVHNHGAENFVEMKPGEQAVVQDGVVTVKRVDARKSIAWIKGKFYFDEMPLEDIMKQLARWYDIEVFFAAQELKSYEFTGLIRKDFSAERVFEIIEKTTQVKFHVKGRSVIVNYK